LFDTDKKQFKANKNGYLDPENSFFSPTRSRANPLISKQKSE
jgi:hypothetical protein